MRGIKSKSTVTDKAPNAYQQALRLLAGRDYTVAALAGKLRLRGCDEAEITLAVERLQKERFLDDRRYAERFVAAARNSGRYVGYRLRQELRRRGLPVELLEELPGETDNEEDETALARRITARRYPSFDPATAGEREQRRVAAFMQRRGFTATVIRSVLRHRGEEDYHDQ